MIISRLLHFTSKRKTWCKQHLEWYGNTLRCSVCGEPAGFRWLKDKSVAVYLFPEFREMQFKITERSDTRKIKSESYVLGEITFREFNQFLSDVKGKDGIQLNEA